MRAAVLGGDGGVRLEERPVPEPPAGEALVRVRLAGLCSTDRELARGYMGFRGTPGHEFVGECVRADDRPELVGRRVVGEINAACGACALCRDGLGRHCPERTVLGILGRPGAFAEYLCLPVGNLHVVPETMGDERAVFAEPVAAAFEVLDQVEVAGRRVVVLGPGKLGGLVAQALAGAGAEVTVVGRRADSLARLARLGFVTGVLDGPDMPAERSADIVCDATGSHAGLPLALRLVRPRGTVVLKTTCAGEAKIDLAPIVIDEITVVGSRCGRFAPALEALGDGRLEPERAITGRFPLGEIREAFRVAFPEVGRGVAGGKVVLELGRG
jgi:threonine dehydrogenase-like Zn-dependent dehydrogenase